MGYACPVCGDPQADATHLANHLAFTALARGGDHEDWLDEMVPEWESMDEQTLGEAVVDDVDQTEYPQVFEDTTGDGHDHEGGRDHAGGDVPREIPDSVLADAEEALADADTADADDVLAEARELTRKRRQQGDGAADDAGNDSETE